MHGFYDDGWMEMDIHMESTLDIYTWRLRCQIKRQKKTDPEEPYRGGYWGYVGHGTKIYRAILTLQFVFKL